MSAEQNLHSVRENGTKRFALTPEQLSEWHTQFYEKPLNCFAQNVCTGRDPINACLQSETNLAAVTQVTRSKCHEVCGNIAKPTTGGPNWICTGLDLLRLGINKKVAAPDLELSAGHLLFWHKLERCNYFLHTVAKYLERCEPLDGRNFRYLMKHPVPDAGNWHMFVNLVKKYGVMPKQCYLTSVTLSLVRLNRILQSKLREYVSLMHAQFTFDGDGSNLLTFIDTKLPELYKVINICLGEPPVEFTYTFYDHKKRYQIMENLTSLSFYQILVKPAFEMDSYVCLAHDPRLSSSYHRNYHIACSSNMVEGLMQNYNNQPMDQLMAIIIASLEAGKAVWLACDRQSRFNAKADVLSLHAHNFEQVFGLKVRTVLDKVERMIYHETRRDAALLLTTVTLDALHQPIDFRTITTAAAAGTSTSQVSLHAEASSAGAKGKKSRSKVAIIQANWLREYAFEIVVSSRFVPPAVMHCIQHVESTELPSWDVMGAFLA
ncbi:bleomycin hydrolase [Drosophila tropicalis]|uniref:bleomycin hydrolase n=1 Tax=Drosophila tropicalis TaxID=46794 RepID=UPI0035AB7B8F